MKDENSLVAEVIGYTLKVMKFHDKDITKFRDEFNAIRHGDYDCFLGLIKEPPPELLFQWKDGIIKDSNFSQKSGDPDITMIFTIEPSIIKFGNDCYAYYGNIVDKDIPNIIFCKCAAFEIAMRVQYNKERQNKKLPYAKSELNKTIDELCHYKDIPIEEKEVLQNGRRFANAVKLNKMNSRFTSWHDGILMFDEAWEICGKYKLKIY